MTFKKIIPSYLLYLAFTVLASAYVFIYAYDFFISFGEDAALNSGLYLLVILVAFALTAYFLHQFSKLLYKKRPHREQRLYIVWRRVSFVLTLILLFVGACWCMYLAEKAPAAETVLFRLIHIPDTSYDNYRTELYAVLMRYLIGIFGDSVSQALLIQGGLYIAAILLMSLSVRILAGRLAAMLSVIFMMFVPIFTVTVKSINPEIMFWLMLSAGLFAAALFSVFAGGDGESEPFILRILVSIFAGFLTGMLVGWDFGLVFLLLFPLFSFFRSRVKLRRYIPCFLIYLCLSVAGFFVSTRGSIQGIRVFISQIRFELPLPVMTHTVMYFVISSLTLVAVFAFFAGRYFERVVIWMMITLYAMYVANQVTSDGISLPGFAILMMLILIGDSYSALVISAAREKEVDELLAKLEEEEKKQSRKKRSGSRSRKEKAKGNALIDNDAETQAEETPANTREAVKEDKPEKTEEIRENQADVQMSADVDKSENSVEVGEDESVNEENPKEAQETTIEELGGEELYIPSGMVLPADDEETDLAPRDIPFTAPGIGKLHLDRTNVSHEETLEEAETREEDEALLDEVGATIAVNQMIEEVGGEAEALRIIDEYNQTHPESDRQEPAQEPTEELTKEPAEDPAQEPIEEPAQEPIDEPAQELTEEPVQEPVAPKLDFDFDLPLVEGDDFDI